MIPNQEAITAADVLIKEFILAICDRLGIGKTRTAEMHLH